MPWSWSVAQRVGNIKGKAAELVHELESDLLRASNR